MEPNGKHLKSGNIESEAKAAWPEYPLAEPEGGVLEAYANIVNADWTLTDVTLRFLQLVHVPREDGATTNNRELIVLERANVTIPWWNAKALAALLAGIIESYESVNGELKLPALAPVPGAPPAKTGT